MFGRKLCKVEVFWETFRDILEVCCVLLDATHSQAKTSIFMFWRFQLGTYSSTFPGVDFRACSNRLFLRLSVIGGALWGGSLWASLFRIGEKVASGVPKEYLLATLSHHVGGFWVTFRRIHAAI